MRLLYAFPEPLPLPRARGLQVLHSLAALAARGVAITLAHAPAPGSPCPFAASGLARPSGVQLLPLSRRLPGPLAALPLDSGRLFGWRLLRHLRRQAYDIVYVRHLKLAAALLRHRPGLPLVYEAHEVFATAVRSRSQRAAYARMESELAARAAIVFISAGLKADYSKHYALPRLITVAHDGAHFPEHCPAKPWHSIKQKITYTGSFLDWKGVHILAAASKLIPDHTIRFAGGTIRDVQIAFGETATASARSIFLGRLSQQAVSDLLSDTCIAVLPNTTSRYDSYTSPLKLFEYMAHGCAIVASDLPALREILGPDDAVWVRPDDPAALAAGIAALTADPQRARRLGERVRDLARAYTWEARAAKIHAFLLDVLDAHDPK